MQADDERDPRTLTRRTLLRTGAAGVGTLNLGALLQACGGSGGGGGGGGAPVAKARRGGSVKMVFGDAVSSDSADPATAFTILANTFSGLVYDGLVRVDNAWNVHPGLAEEFSHSADFRTYTFKLRDGVQFHSGKRLAADDVVFSIRRMFDAKLGSPGLGIFGPVLDPADVRAVDARTVRFRLKAPDVDFFIKVGHWYGKVIPAGTKDFTNGSFGTGPFKTVSFKGGEGFVVERNANYWESGRPYLDRVEGVVITEAATRAQAVLTGDADISDPPTFPLLSQFKASSSADLVESPFGPPVVFGIDGSTAPFNDPDVRRAAKLAVDRQKMVTIVARGYGTASPDDVVNPNEVYWPGGVQAAPHDPEQARSLLSKAGFQGPVPIWTTSGLRALGDGATLLAEQWNAAGLKAQVKSVSFDELLGKRFLHEKVVANYWLRQHYSTILPFLYRSDGPYNESRLKDPQLDRLISQLQRTPQDRGGKDILREILNRYNNEAASLWPFHMKDVWARKNRIQNMKIVPTEQVDMRNVFVA